MNLKKSRLEKAKEKARYWKKKYLLLKEEFEQTLPCGCTQEEHNELFTKDEQKAVEHYSKEVEK